MSHIASIKVEIRDLNALKLAVAELGGQWAEGKQTYTWYGQWVGDTPLPAHLSRDDLGKCAHVIKVPGVHYEVGVVRLPNGHYTLAYDFFNGGGGTKHDGHKLMQRFGEGCQKLVQTYAVHKATLAAKAKGYLVSRQSMPNGGVKLVMTNV